MKQLEPTEFPKQQVRWESVFRDFYEPSSRTEFAGGRLNAVG
jgi:hypothetical protein